MLVKFISRACARKTNMREPRDRPWESRGIVAQYATRIPLEFQPHEREDKYVEARVP